MKQLTCEMCGSTNMLKEDGVFVCQSCGCKYSVEEAKKMMIEGTVEIQGTVKIDDTEKVKNYLSLAYSASENDLNEKAIEYCEKALEIDPKNPEAWDIKSNALFMAAITAGVKSKLKFLSEACSAFMNALHNCDDEKKLEGNFILNAELMTYVLGSYGESFVEHPTKKNIECMQKCLSEAISNYKIMFSYFEYDDECFSKEDDNNLESNKKLFFKYKCIKELFTSFVKSRADVTHEYTSCYTQYKAERSVYSTKQGNNPCVYKLSLCMEMYDYLTREFKQEELKYTECKELLKKIYEEKADTCIWYNRCIYHSGVNNCYSCKEGIFYVINLDDIYRKIKELDLTFKTPEDEETEFKASSLHSTDSTTTSPTNLEDSANLFVEMEKNIQKAINDEKRSKGCYVATCVYGSYDCPEVWTLRRFRDNTLGATWYGRLFIRTYYAISPTLVKWFGKTTWFKKMWQGALDRMVNKLNCNGVENTPYQDKEW